MLLLLMIVLVLVALVKMTIMILVNMTHGTPSIHEYTVLSGVIHFFSIRKISAMTIF